MYEQEQDLRRFAESKGWQVVGIYADAGLSGKLRKRPQQSLLLNDVKRHKIDVVLCWRVDRWSRDAGNFYLWTELLVKNGAKLVCSSQDVDTSTAMGKMMMGMLALFADVEAMMDGDRTSQIVQNAKADHRYLPTSPWGLTKFGRKYVWESPEKRAVVVDIWKRAKEGQSERAIAGVYTAAMMGCKETCKSARDTIRGILDCSIYAGVVTMTKRDGSHHGARIPIEQRETYAVDIQYPIMSWPEMIALRK